MLAISAMRKQSGRKGLRVLASEFFILALISAAAAASGDHNQTAGPDPGGQMGLDREMDEFKASAVADGDNGKGNGEISGDHNQIAGVGPGREMGMNREMEELKLSEVAAGENGKANDENGDHNHTAGPGPGEEMGPEREMEPIKPSEVPEDGENGVQEQRESFDANGMGRKAGPFAAGLWHYAHATFYGDESAQDTMQGACGYQNLWQQGYGTDTTALSTTLFNGGFACGSCFEIRCVASWNCNPGNPSTKVTATNFCPPNWARPTNNGGWCNPPRQHFDMAKPAFEKIAYWRAGIVPVAYRRVPCTKQGNMEFLIEGNQWWHIVFITNVGGPGDIGQVYVRSSKADQWMEMMHNWGAGYQIFRNFLGESLSFMVVSNSNYETVVSWNMVPSNWQLGSTYIGGQFKL